MCSSISEKLNRIFNYTLSASDIQTDGNNFSRFSSIYISKVIENINNREFKSNDNFCELNEIFDLILLIWDDYLMTYSNIPSRYTDNFEYENKPKERSIFELIIREMIRDLMNNIDDFVNNMPRRSFENKWDLYKKNKKLMYDVLKIGLELPLEEMFNITQSRSDLPIHLHCQHNVDRFIQIYLWTILNILHEGHHYDFEKVLNVDMECCSICYDNSTTNKEFVKIKGGCVHSFCISCLSTSLKKNKNCPYCRLVYPIINISDICQTAVLEFFSARKKRNDDAIYMKLDESQILTQFFEKNGFDITNIYTEHPIRCFSTCGNLYTKNWKGSHKCGPYGDSHHATKHIGMASLSILHPTECCLKCNGSFYVYKECGHILCESHLDSTESCCPKCNFRTYTFKLNIPIHSPT